MYSRRDFGKIALSAIPMSAAFAKINSKVDGVQLGVQTYSFRDMSLDDAIKAIVADGLGECELFAPHVEPPGLGKGTMGGRPPVRGQKPDPAVVAARQKAREELRTWRETVPISYFTDVRKKFNDAGIGIYAYNYSFNDNFSDKEIDRGFEFAKALGARFITASTTLPVAKRVVPFADKHKMVVAMHGHSNLKDPDQFAKPESFTAAMEMSKYYKINLDIGHFTAANYDAVDYIEKNHANIVLLHLKDRKKDEGPNTVWGEGDTPIKAVLQLLKTKKYPIPAFIEYEYHGAGSSQEEVKKCFEYAKQALEANS